MRHTTRVDAEEYNVDVVFRCRDFELRVHWLTDISASDEARVDGASLWFTETYGMNPSDIADSIAVEPPHDS